MIRTLRKKGTSGTGQDEGLRGRRPATTNMPSAIGTRRPSPGSSNQNRRDGAAGDRHPPLSGLEQLRAGRRGRVSRTRRHPAQPQRSNRVARSSSGKWSGPEQAVQSSRRTKVYDNRGGLFPTGMNANGLVFRPFHSSIPFLPFHSSIHSSNPFLMAGLLTTRTASGHGSGFARLPGQLSA